MKTLISAGQAADMVWNALTTESEGIFMLREIRLHAAYLAYGYHKRYPVTGRGGHSFKYIAENDKLLNDLYDSIANDNIPNLKLGNAYEELSKIPHYEFEKNYPDILNGLNDKLSRNSGTKSDDYFTPPGITSLIAYFVNKEECKSVFDPFCGTASIVHKLQGGVLFEGQDIDTGTSLIARVNMEARYGRDKGIACCDSLYEWNNKSFDAVVSCPPYGISIPKRENGLKQGDGFYRDAEEMVIRNSLKINHAKISILLLHAGVLSQVRARRIRKFLLENNYLDTIISLPPNILYNSSTQYILLICKSDRKPGAP